MRILIIFIIILFTINPCYSFSFLKKKDYKQNFINDALNAEKRHNNDSAFHLFEKALFYYKKDKSLLEAYAGFCEREKYFVKAQELYQRLYVLTKNPNYLFKKDLAEIKNGKLSKEQVQKLTKGRHLTKAQEIDVNIALIEYFSYIGDWESTKKSCDNVKKNSIGKDLITTCIVASEKTKDKQAVYQYLKRYSEIYPQDSNMLKRIISLAGEYNDYASEEALVKKFSELNPSDRGIKYRLAGLYEKHGDYKKAIKVYEKLIASGDNSKHVKDSYAYVLGMSKGIHNKKNPEYIPKPLTQRELKEKAMYEALDKKDYAKVVSYLDDLLKSTPTDTKLLKLRVDMALAQDDYPQAIIFFERLKTLNYSLSLKDEKLLAFSYSKTENYPKAIEIVESLFQKNADNKAENKDLMDLALEYSMAGKNWEKALFYVNKLLVLEPNSEKLLKIQGDIYATNKDFCNAINSYVQLVQNYPKLEYYLALANFYMANQNFAQAQMVLEPLSNLYPCNVEITEAFLNSLLAQQKIRKAYCFIKARHLEKTKNGYMIFGDMAMMDKKFKKAECYYTKALKFDPEDITLQNKLANAYRELECIDRATQLYRTVLAKDPCNLQAMLGLGYLEIDKKNYEKSRKMFNYKALNVKVKDFIEF